jgi:hypothetical protein
MDILFLANRPAANTQAATVTEYLDALHRFSGHRVFEISMLNHFPGKLELDRFDAVIIHYSLSIGPLIDHYLGPDLIAQIKAYRGLKAAFLQDEYREIQTYWRHINELGLDVLFSCVPDNEIPKVYPPDKVPGVRVVNVLTGYVPEALMNYPSRPIAERAIDVGYRSRKMPYWLGRLGHEKTYIAEEFARRGEHHGLCLDLSTKEGERLYGPAWTQFIASCRAVIGAESGASIIDFDGQLERRVNDYCARNPKADFEEVFDRFLAPFEGSLRLHQISPRCFEAAALRTPMILFEGYYSGILVPDRHFIPLKKDFSNFDEVLAKLADSDGLQVMADRTYAEVAANPHYHYSAFIEIIDRVLSEEVANRQTVPARAPYDRVDFTSAVRRSLGYSVRRWIVLRLQSFLLGVPVARRALFGLWFALPQPLKRVARPMARLISR